MVEYWIQYKQDDEWLDEHSYPTLLKAKVGYYALYGWHPDAESFCRIVKKVDGIIKRRHYYSGQDYSKLGSYEGDGRVS